MDPSCLVSTVQAGGGGVMVWGIFSWHTLGPLVPIKHRLNATAYLSNVVDHVHPFMTTVYHLLMATSSRIMHHVTKLNSSQTGFLNMTMSSLYSNGLQSPDLNPIEHLWDVVEWEIRWRGPHSGAHLDVLDSADLQGCRGRLKVLIHHLIWIRTGSGDCSEHLGSIRTGLGG